MSEGRLMLRGGSLGIMVPSPLDLQDATAQWFQSLGKSLESKAGPINKV